MINRRDAKRSVMIYLEPCAPGEKGRKTLKAHLGEFVHGEITKLEVLVDGVLYDTLYPHSEHANRLYLPLNEQSHTITLSHPRLKRNPPTVTIPYGYDNYNYIASERNDYRLVLEGRMGPLPSIGYRSAPVSCRIAEFLVGELRNGGVSYNKLKIREAWSMWLECYEDGFDLGYFTTDAPYARSVRSFTYESFCRTPGDYELLSIADAIGLEDWLMRQVKLNLPADSDLEFYTADQYHCVRCPMDPYHSPTTWELRRYWIEQWQEDGLSYRQLHGYDVFKAQMHFTEQDITLHFEGYDSRRKNVPADFTIKYASFAPNSSNRYMALTEAEGRRLEQFLVDALENECKLISIAPVAGSPHSYNIIDNRKIYYEGQEPYWV